MSEGAREALRKTKKRAYIVQRGTKRALPAPRKQSSTKGGSINPPSRGHAQPNKERHRAAVAVTHTPTKPGDIPLGAVAAMHALKNEASARRRDHARSQKRVALLCQEVISGTALHEQVNVCA
jgi:hypothetical protein